MLNISERPVVRLAVSPVEGNGRIGPLRTHLLGYGYGRSLNAIIIVRKDDTNTRLSGNDCFPDLYKQIAGLGMIPDVDPFNSNELLGCSLIQSERFDVYGRYIDRLFDIGLAKVDRDSGLTLFDVEKFACKYGADVEVNDAVSGVHKFCVERCIREGVSTFPLVRSDGSFLYHLASVADDAEFGVTHIVRGNDKLSIAQYQEMIRIALGLQPITYAHTPMLRGQDNSRLRNESLIKNYLKMGIVPEALVSYMISSGYGDPERIYLSMDEFVSGFDPKKIHRSDGKFDLAQLKAINRKILAKMTHGEYRRSLARYCMSLNDPKMVEKMNANPDFANGTKRDVFSSINALANL